MAELTVFAYRHNNSWLNALDVRFKLLFLIMLSLASLWTGPAGLMILTLTYTVVFPSHPFPLGRAFRELKVFFILVLFILAARALTVPGPVLVGIGGISITRTGLYEGILVSWRLVLVVMFSLLLVASTKSRDIKAAVEWFLTPFPFIPAKRVAVMIGLIIRFIPLIFDQAGETADAQRARGIENRRNPIYRLSKLAIPLIRRVFETADRLILAMEARCYTENRTNFEFSLTRTDWTALASVLILCILIVAL